MHLSMQSPTHPQAPVGICAPINVFPHHPPLGIIWGNSGDLTYPNVKFPTVGQTEYVKYTYVYTCIYAYVKYTVYTCVKCPIVGQKFCVNSPSKAPLRPEGGVVGEYIDRCIVQLIIQKIHPLGKFFCNSSHKTTYTTHTLFHII